MAAANALPVDQLTTPAKPAEADTPNIPQPPPAPKKAKAAKTAKAAPSKKRPAVAPADAPPVITAMEPEDSSDALAPLPEGATGFRYQPASVPKLVY